MGIPNPSPFSPITQVEKKVFITLCVSMFGRDAVTVRPENKSVMSICPELSSAPSMISTCMTSLNWSTSVSMMSEW